MFAILNGMAVLVMRLSLVVLSYQLLSKINWRAVLTDKNYVYAQPICLLISLGIGHLAGSFLMTIVEIFYQTVQSLTY